MDALDGFHQLQALRFCETSGDLVQQKQPWPRRQGPGHLQTLALQQGQGAGQGIGLADQPGQFQDMRTPVVAGLFRLAGAEGGAHQEVLEHRHLHKRVRDLVRAANAASAALEHRLAGHVLAGQENAPAVRADAAGYQTE
ncbi:hypothetical protein D3C71_1743920 [compost metagenome]